MTAFPAPSSPDGTTLRVLVVDDEYAVREGLRRLITGSAAHTPLVRIAANPAEALHEAAALRPHVVVLDIDLAGEDGLALVRHFEPACQVLVLTSHGDPGTRARALALGARAFVEKDAPASILLAQLNTLAAAQLGTSARH
ncbi:MAG TPA: response regulator [Burkholderiaceae bacterium]|jgi:two-component system response regulator DesR|nr:response regulator [Burkholderiaceae bacterium]